MPSKSAIEKAQKRLEAQQRREARKAAKEQKQKEKEAAAAAAAQKNKQQQEEEEASTESKKLAANNNDSINNNNNNKQQSDDDDECWMLKLLNDDAIHELYCMLPARDLGCLIMTCKRLNQLLGAARVAIIQSRFISRGASHLCKDKEEVRRLIQRSLIAGGNTGRLITKKSRKSMKNSNNDTGGDADEFIAYARFLEEAVCGYCILSTSPRRRSEEPIFLSKYIHGRICSVSPEHSLCRVGGDGSTTGPGGSGVASWGVGKRGQLGHGQRSDVALPKLLLGGIGFGPTNAIRIVQVSAGGGLTRVAHSLLLTSTGRVLAFGNGQYGQLGMGYSAGNQLPDYLRPQYVDSLQQQRCICVSAGELHSSAVTSDGDLYTWGDGFCGQLGHGDKRPQLSPKLVQTGGLEDECVTMVSAGCRHTLVVTEDGEVWSFGLGHFGVLGRSFTPFEYDADAAVMQFGAGGGGGVNEVGFAGVAAGARGGGNNNNNEEQQQQVGTNNDVQQQQRHVHVAADEELAAHLDLIANLSLDDSSDQCIATIVDSLKGICMVGVCAGHRHSLFLDNQGGLYSCGSGKTGALGHGDTQSCMYPMKITMECDANIQIMQMSAGVDISMAVSTCGQVYSWGKSDGGRIGLGMMSEIVTKPRQVQQLQQQQQTTTKNDDDDTIYRAIDVECGYVHSLIVGLDGTIHICGGVGIDGKADGIHNSATATDNNTKKPSQEEEEDSLGKPILLQDFNVWHRIPEPKAAKKKKQERWKKYGKYEVKGRAKMMMA